MQWLQAVNDYVRSNLPKLSPGVKELIHTLQSKGKTVFLVSGGFRQVSSLTSHIRMQKYTREGKMHLRDSER
jgi:phosphoserine phosphatase